MSNPWKDMANDAGYPYGTDENRMMAQMIEQDYMLQAAYEDYHREQQEKWQDEQWEIYCDEMDYYDWLLDSRVIP